MFLLPLFAIAFVVLLALGGKVGRLADAPLAHPWLAFVGVFGTHFAYKSGLYYGTPLVGRPIWLASILAIGLCMYLNRRQVGLLVASLGALSNALVITANGGRMPTGRWGYHMLERMPAWYREPGIVGGDPQIPLPWTSAHTHLNFLADVLPPVFPLGYPFSFGDALLGVGIIWYLATAMLRRPVAVATPSTAPAAPTPVLSPQGAVALVLRRRPGTVPGVAAPAPTLLLVPQHDVESGGDQGEAEVARAETAVAPAVFAWTFAVLGTPDAALEADAA